MNAPATHVYAVGTRVENRKWVDDTGQGVVLEHLDEPEHYRIRYDNGEESDAWIGSLLFRGDP
jgi:hypothetical protein